MADETITTKFEVRHYGSDRVPDPDCTTFIQKLTTIVTEGGRTHVYSRTMELENDQQVDDLIAALTEARDNSTHIPRELQTYVDRRTDGC